MTVSAPVTALDRDAWYGERIAAYRRCFESLASEPIGRAFWQAAAAMARCLAGGGTVFWCGNGGSAGDSQHLAAELVGRFGRPGRGWPSVALTTDSSVLTATANDFGYETVFERQAGVLVRPGDMLVAISTSGRSPNVLHAVEVARTKGAVTLALTGPADSPLGTAAGLVLRAPGETTSEIQTGHIALGQMLCEAAIQLAEADSEEGGAC